jgi:hypothetical protein
MNLITLEQANVLVGEDVACYVEEARNSGEKIFVKDYRFWLLGEFDERRKVCYGNVYLYTPDNKVYVINGTYTRFYVGEQETGIGKAVKKIWRQLLHRGVEEEVIHKIA